MKPACLVALGFCLMLLCHGCQLQHHECALDFSCLNTHVHSSQSCVLKGKYVGTPVQYYANSESTFQSLLLISGDISPNPGPDNVKSNLPQKDNSHSITSYYKYDSQTLHSLNTRNHFHFKSWFDTNQTAWSRIVSLGINRRRKTHRGRRSKHTHVGNYIRLGVLNVRSIRNKSSIFHDFVLDHHFDFTCICETWLTTSDDAVIEDLRPSGYTFLHRPRVSKRGGGVGFLYKNDLKVVMNPPQEHDTFESMHGTISNSSSCLDIIVLYRPPSNQSFSAFLDEFSELLDMTIYKPSPIVITGDLNIHLDSTSSLNTQKFNDLLSSHGLSQLVTSPTHDKGHTLDVVIVRNSDDLLCSGLKVVPGISDHSAITCRLRHEKPLRTDSTFTCRNIKAIDRAALADDVASCIIMASDTDSVDKAVQMYNSHLCTLLDSHAPAKTRTIKNRNDCPWFNSDISAAKRKRRRLERKWRSNGKLHIDRELWCAQKNLVNSLLMKAKRSHYVGLVEDCGSDSRKLFSLANRLLNRKQSTPLPCHTDSHAMAETFIQFFQTKVRTICDSLHPDESLPQPFTASSLETLHPTDPDEIQSILRNIPPKSCQLDPIPTVLLKDCSSTFAPIISQIVNLSIDQAEVPTCLKIAHVTPLLKKSSLDPEVLQNYRPVSNLPFLFKILERVVFSRLTEYFSDNNLFDPFQSAYRPNHSVETLLVNVSNSILQGMDKGNISAMFLLDLSSAFDTVNHTVLLNTLSSFGVRGRAYEWFQSYLSCHSQIVCINDCKSTSKPLTHGVPQGSVGGPTLFSIYLISLGHILRRHNINYHIYADDIQLYLSFKPNQADAKNAITRLENCLSDILFWLNSHSLKLNLSKTEFLLFGSRTQLSKVNLSSISFSGCTVNVSQTCRNLGIMLDYGMSMSNQITNICRSVRYQLRNIGFIRKYLSKSATEKLVHALISSRLDFGNALLYNLPKTQLSKLQKLQNAAARMVTLSKKHDHITPILKSLHWLKVNDRIIFKILLLVFHAINGSAPLYNINLINKYTPVRLLRSSNSGFLVVPKSTKAWGVRAFAHAGPVLWNDLPLVIRECTSVDTFKRYLKTRLFNASYS